MRLRLHMLRPGRAARFRSEPGRSVHTRGMRALVTSLTVILVALVFPLAAAAAAEPVIVAVSDPANDAHNTTDSGLSNADRRSIDIRRLVVTDEGDTVRFTFRILRVARSPRLTQIFLVDIATKQLPYSQLSIATHPLTRPPLTNDGLHHSMGIEGADTAQGFVECHRLHVSMRNGARTFWVEVPKRCLPAGPARLKVYTQTVQGPGLSDNAQYSEDTLRIRGRYDLGGTVHALSQ